MRTLDTSKMYYKTFTASTERAKSVEKGIGEGDFKNIFTNDHNEDRAVKRFIGSSEVKDRDGDIVVLSGIDYTNFKSNPVVLWGHNARELPIGKVVAVNRDETERKEYFDIQFASTSKAQEIATLVDEGMIKATSIGFRVKDWDYDEILDAFIFKAIEIMEISLCTIPANQEAVVDVTEVKETKEKSMSAEDIQELVREAVAAALENKEEPKPETDEVTEPEVVEDPAPNEEAPQDVASLVTQLIDLIGTLTPNAQPETPQEPVDENPEPGVEVDEPADEEAAEEEGDEDRSEESKPETEVVDLSELTNDDEFVIIQEEN